jgi:hypothetical protein
VAGDWEKNMTDANLCVYDGGTGAIVKNRLNATGEIRIVYFYN